MFEEAKLCDQIDLGADLDHWPVASMDSSVPTRHLSINCPDLLHWVRLPHLPQTTISRFKSEAHDKECRSSIYDTQRKMSSLESC